MLLTGLPVASVYAAVGIGVDAVALLLVVYVMAAIVASVGPPVVTLAVHVVVLPVAFVRAAVLPLVDAIAGDLVVLPGALEDASIGPGVNSVAILHSVLVISIVPCAIGPGLLALTLLDIVHPFALVATSIDVSVDAVPVSLVGPELADVDVALGVPERTLAFSFIILPVSLVDGAVDPLLNSEAAALLNALFRSLKHLTFIEAAVGKLKQVDVDDARDVLSEVLMNLIMRLFESISLINTASRSIVVDDGVRHWLLVTVLHRRLFHGTTGAIAV